MGGFADGDQEDALVGAQGAGDQEGVALVGVADLVEGTQQANASLDRSDRPGELVLGLRL